MQWQDSAERYSPIGRFFLLFLIWGAVGYSYKIFMNLTLPGFMLSMLFFATSALLVIGLFTRASAAALGVTLIIHGYVQGSTASILCGVASALSAAFPIGAYLSVDRYLQLRGSPEPYVPAASAVVPLSPLAIGMFAVLAAFMIGGPTYNQIFHHRNMIFRSWDMFHKIGANVVNVRFFLADAAGQRDTDYMAQLGHVVNVSGTNRRENRRFKNDINIVGADRLEAIITRMCASVRNPSSLRVEARIASMKDGWKRLYDGSEPICMSHSVGVVS